MIGAVENAIVTRLKLAGDPEAGVLGYRYGTVDTYPEDWQVFWEKDGSRINYPAAFVTFAGIPSTTNYNGGVAGRAIFGLIVIAKNMRNQVAARQGTDLANDVGSYQLARDAVGLLEGSRLGLPIGALELKSMQFVSPTEQQRKAGLSLMALRFETEIDLIDDYFEPSAEFLGEFETFQVRWDLPSSDGRAELTQTIQPNLADIPPVAIEEA